MARWKRILGAVAVFASCGGPEPSGSVAPGGHSLSIHLAGGGSGAVRSATPPFECRSQCTQTIAAGAAVHLNAVADANSTFAGWQGACAGTGDCAATMDGDKDVTATFMLLVPPPSPPAPPPSPGSVEVTVSLVGDGRGRVTSSPAGIDCPTTCTMTVAAGTTVSLAQQADGSSGFVGWGGGCSGNGGCTFAPTTATTVWANFAANAPPPPPTRSSCEGIAPPDDVPMQKYVHAIDRQQFVCLPGAADASGTLALPRELNDSTAHGSFVEFATTQGALLKDQYDSSEGLHLLQQPRGAAAWGDGGHLNPRQDELVVRAWDSSGNPSGDAVLFGKNVASAADPGGGVLLAGELGTLSGSYTHAATVFSGGGTTPKVRWGPTPLASDGAVFGAGVDVLGRSLVITDGGSKLGPGSISGQWFEANGKPMTGEFLLVSNFVAGPSTWFETSALIGGGLLVRRVDDATHAQALVVVASGTSTVSPAPDWMKTRPDTKLQIARGGRAYAVLPYGGAGKACSQHLEIVAPDGTSCGARDYTVASGTCDLNDLTLGADGTVIQQLPRAMEASEPVRESHTCTWRFWPGAAN